MLLCPQLSRAEFRNFSILVDTSASSLITADDGKQWTPFEFGITVAEDGTVTRVASDAADKAATISGKVHSDHGAANLKLVVPVDGPVKIAVATCTYSTGDITVTDAEGKTVATATPVAACWKNDHSSLTMLTYQGEATTLTISGMSYCAYVSVEKTEGISSSFDKTDATFAWAVGNETEATFDEDLAKGVSSTKVSVGSDLTKTDNVSYTLGDITAGPYVQYTPITTNPGCVNTDMIEYTVDMKKGVTFTPTSVEFDAVKKGTDNAYFSWSYTIDGEEGKITTYSDPKNQIRRDQNQNPSAPLTHIEAITGAKAGKKFTLRFYISNVANNKAMAIGNIKIKGTMDGEVIPRAFKDFKIDFRTEDPTIVYPSEGLPENVTLVKGTYKDNQHGTMNGKLTFPVDGPVKFTVGGCQYTNTNATIKNEKGEVIATLDQRSAGCDGGIGSYNKNVTWTYNSEEAQTLTVELGQYCPYIEVVACDLIPMRSVKYFNTDGTTLIGTVEVEGGSELAYSYGEGDVTIPEGSKFRGWFNSKLASAVKVKEGISVQENLELYAKATPIEKAKVGVIFNYPLNSLSFYPEDHECFSTTGTFHDGQHGFSFGSNGTISLNVAGNALVVIGTCQYGNASTLTVTDAEGNQVGEAVTLPGEMGTDGAKASFAYSGPATTLTATLSNGGYIHDVMVYNVESVPEKNAEGYYALAPNDGASLQLVLAALQEGDKIYLPNGTYDFGEKALTTISAKNVSIIGESMDGTIIRNCPPIENEGIGTTATLLNTSDGLYLQDLTIQNALDYYGSSGAGRAVCLQEKGQNTICKRVKLLSYQDTYYSNRASNFYWEDSEIHGTVDYLCGDGNVIYNRVTLVNESRSKTPQSGDCTICAPHCTASTDSRKNWGYVFLDCTVKTLSASFNFGRSWGGESKATYINTTVLEPSAIAKSRFTTGGMKVAAYSFKEYRTMNSNGNVISPASNKLTFTHSTGNRTMETILTDDEAKEYTIENIFGEWAPDKIAADVTEGTVYLVDGEITSVKPTTVGSTYRVANARGGFGQTLTVDTTGIEETVKTENTDAIIYNALGQRINANTKGLQISRNGKKFVK